ncbi:polysaccharide biosynthesis/export family protein [Dongia soli]|uniref:Polysaccharide biosynthesis/export family protein n=2 Tax=Dongia soli TaxID=600628 RepID=A0ABU5EFM1_9PROT|nr:polysaccharide biosynthesis/export family protein [Dongia soli]
MLTCLAGCTSAPPIQTGATNGYHLGAGDRVQIEVYNDREMSGQFEVDAGGQVSIPLIGGVQLGGLTLREAEQAIADKLKSEKIVNDPNVSVNISQYRPIYVTGEVQRSGQFPFASGMTVLTGVALANGYTPRADPDRIEITRAPDTKPKAATESTTLEPGDVVKVLQRWF